MMLEAVLLDRDGVINRERSDYVKNWQEFELLPGALSALTMLADLDCPILVISNQSAIGRDLMTWDTLNGIHEGLRSAVTAQGGRIDAFYVCPHHPDDKCACRKPQPGLLLQAAREYNVAPENCIFVGDSVTDLQAAFAAGCRSILVRTGRQGQQIEMRLEGFSECSHKDASTSTIEPDRFVSIVQDLGEAVSLILAENELGSA